jgi:hypothetical protein
MLAVSINVSASVALPLRYDDAVSEGAIEDEEEDGAVDAGPL